MYSDTMNSRFGLSWMRVGTNVCYYQSNQTFKRRSRRKAYPYYIASFTVMFPYDKDIVYFAYCLPYSYLRLQLLLNVSGVNCC